MVGPLVGRLCDRVTLRVSNGNLNLRTNATVATVVRVLTVVTVVKVVTIVTVVTVVKIMTIVKVVTNFFCFCFLLFIDFFFNCDKTKKKNSKCDQT